jgi:hypothetical protein
VVTIVADYKEIVPLLSQLGLKADVIAKVSGWINKAVSIAQDFDAHYKAGDFKNAVTLFTSLGGLITDIASELNVANNRIVNLLLVGIQIARITIASLLKVQADNQPLVARAARKAASAAPADALALSEINRLAAIDVSRLLAVSQ